MLVYVWSQMSCCKWLKLSSEFHFAVQHAEPRYMKLWHHNDLIYARYHHWHFWQFCCSKHDVTMVSDCQATERMRNDHSGSNVLKMGRHNTLLLLTVITKVPVECILNQHNYVCVIFWWRKQKKMQNVAELYCHASNIYLWLQTLWSSQMEKNNYIFHIS